MIGTIGMTLRMRTRVTNQISIRLDSIVRQTGPHIEMANPSLKSCDDSWSVW